MKKTLACIGMCMLYLLTTAQQKPHYTQYILNQYIINPALTGIENYTDLKASHRLQWVGLADAPVTTYLSIHGPIGKKDLRTTATSFEVPGENPRGNRYWETYTAAEPHHGWGVQVINDRTGPLNQFSAFGTYAYHLGLSEKTNLAAGIGAGINNITLNRDKLQFATAIDPSVYSSGYINRIRFDMNAGLYLYSSDYFVGLSAQQIIPSDIVFSANVVKKLTTKPIPHFFATAGYRFLVNDVVNITPSLMIKYVNPLPVQPEVNVKVQYTDKLWVAAGYRHQDGVTAMAGMYISNLFNIGYSYDYTTSNLNNFTKGTHELILGFTLGNRFGDSCPRNVW